MSVIVLEGSDASLVSRELSRLLEELSPDDAPGELEEYTVGEESDDGEGRGRFDLGPVLAALTTPGFLSERRVVVLRGAGALTAAQAGELARVIAEPPTENVLVLTSEGRALPAPLNKAIKAAGARVVETEPGRNARSRNDWMEKHLQGSSVHLDAAARRRVSDHIGQDAARLDPILDLLEAAYGPGHRVSEEELEPVLGEEGAVPPWDLTDAIDAGDGEAAVRALHRLLHAGKQPPLVVMSSLHRHFQAMLRLDGADVSSPERAAEILKIHAFRAQKALTQARRLGHDRVARAIEVLASADVDLRGRVGWPEELVLEVAVARLAQLSRQTARPAAQQQRRR